MDRDALEQLLALLPASPDDDDLVPSGTVRKENGDICDMTLWRWLRQGRPKDLQAQSPEESVKIPFPPPDFIINGRRFWKRRTLRQHRYQMELEKPHPVKGAASFVQSQTRSTHSPQKEERHAREADRRR